MDIIEKKLSEIIPYDKNPRKNDEAVKYVEASIKEFGFKVPIVIDKDNVIVAGHTRYKAANKLKMEKVPCIVADDLTEEQIKAFRLADNKVAEQAEWDFDLLADELEGLLDFDMEQFGFDLTLDEEEIEPQEDDFNDSIPAEPVSKSGQVYKLGEHRLMVGDSTSQQDVKKLLCGVECDMMVTDPPYNVAIKNSDGLTIENDNMSSDNFNEFLTSAFESANIGLKEGAAFYVWYASKEHINFESAMNKAGFKVREQLIWNKNTFILGRQDYHWKHEPCLYGWKDGASHYFIDDRTQSTVVEDEKKDIKKMSKQELIEFVKDLTSDKQSTTVINEDKPAKDDLHPTMKPVKLIARQIKNSSKVGECVLDLFGGSGTTLIACEQLRRKCFMMEYDPRYADVIIRRWEEFTGEKAELMED